MGEILCEFELPFQVLKIGHKVGRTLTLRVDADLAFGG